MGHLIAIILFFMSEELDELIACNLNEQGVECHSGQKVKGEPYLLLFFLFFPLKCPKNFMDW